MNYAMWMNESSLGCWGSDFANQVTGNDGVHFWPGISQDAIPKIFTSQLFRMIQMSSNSTVTFKGIELYKFEIPVVALQNSSVFPPNNAYYQFGQPGVMNLTSCQQGAPIFMSKPHFLDGQWYESRVNGLSPNRSLHDTWLGIEPNLGQTFVAYKRLQVNLRLIKEPLLYPNIQDGLYIPVAWFEQFGEATDDQASQFKDSVYRAITAKKVIQISGLTVGILLFILAIVLGIFAYRLHMKKTRYTLIQ